MENRLDFTSYRALVRRVAAEGCVLLRNENKALPLQSGARIALFGRAQSAYYKSGTGSGGMVNTRPVASIAEALEKEDGLTLDRDVLEAYKDFYADAAFTHYSDKSLDLKQVVNTNKCLVHVDGFEGKILVTSCIDNLLKGAVGQAVQNMNIMFGLDETAGLRLKASAF